MRGEDLRCQMITLLIFKMAQLKEICLQIIFTINFTMDPRAVEACRLLTVLQLANVMLDIICWVKFPAQRLLAAVLGQLCFLPYFRNFFFFEGGSASVSIFSNGACSGSPTLTNVINLGTCSATSNNYHVQAFCTSDGNLPTRTDSLLYRLEWTLFKNLSDQNIFDFTVVSVWVTPHALIILSISSCIRLAIASVIPPILLSDPTLL